MTIPNYISDAKQQLVQALSYLDYSYNKIQKLPDDPALLDQESLETWESFTARFARVADIFMMKYIRAQILHEDPGFRGTLRDFLNAAEKIRLIDNIEIWMTIRALRNISAHEYSVQDLQKFFLQLKKHTPKLLALKALLEDK